METVGVPIIELSLDRTGDPPFESGVICAPGSTVRFVLKSHFRIALKNPVLHTNYPFSGKSFDRHKFTALPSQTYDGKLDWYADITFETPGTFDYYLVITDGNERHRCKSGTVLVTAPVLVNGVTKPRRAVCTLTTLTRSLGPLSAWPKHFAKFSQLGYNGVHFTSLNELGYSQSAYCIRNQLGYSPHLFGDHQPASVADQKALIQSTLKCMEQDHGILGLVDMVWNHTSADSPWLAEHPEATYNLENSGHLKPAFLLDDALQKLCADVANGVYEARGLGTSVNDERSLTVLCQIIERDIFPALRLWEYFVVDVDDALHEFEEAIETVEKHEPSTIFLGNEVECLKKEALSREERGWGRFSLKVNSAWAIKLFAPSAMRRIDFSKLPEKVKEYQAALNTVNLPLYEKLNEDLRAALSNIANRIRYERIDPSGPRHTAISIKTPLISPLFTKIVAKATNKPFYAANNGWVWGGNPTQNFAEFPGSAYLRRELIVWSDLVKLRYGFQPSDSPWLWEHMKQYTIQNAELFHGFRIDNCHSTPISVARYMLDAARVVRPGLFVTAELFTGSEKYDNLFVSKLGINSLIRESMQCSDAAELGRVIYTYTGDPIGSVVPRFSPAFYQQNPNDNTAWITPVQPTTPPAFLFDCTHDNKTPWKKRTGEDYLPNMALVSMARLPIGSVAGYDWIVSDNPHVDEQRLYPVFEKDTMVGIMQARKFFNELHTRLEQEGFTQTHIHQDGDLLTIVRHNPTNRKGVVCIAHTAFHGGNKFNKTPADVNIQGTITKYAFCARLAFNKADRDSFYEAKHCTAARASAPPTLSKEEYIVGEDGELLIVPEEDLTPHIFTVNEVNRFSIEVVQRISFHDFRPGSVLVLETQLPPGAHEAIAQIRENVNKPLPIATVNLIDANYILYRCNAEERDSTGGTRGVYNVPGYGDLVYAGLQGVVSVLDKIRASNDLGHPLFNNIRAGNWLMDYIVDRLENVSSPTCSSSVKAVGQWLRTQFDLARKVPRYLIPRTFDIIVMKAYYSIRHQIQHYGQPTTPRGNFILEAQDRFVSDLALCGVQLVGSLSSVSLIHPQISGDEQRFRTTMAAGFPHFAQGYMRVWGRDTFVSFRGLLLLPGRYEEAREMLIGFAATLRHGLIPNLVDSAWNTRYNSRDAVWWFLYALQQYCLVAPEGHAFLSEKTVPRIFKSDSEVVQAGKTLEKVSMASIVQEIMERHANGIHFRERNAGEALDSQMSDRGFNVDISMDSETGFIVGGSAGNCGTWMDKMGSNQHAGNKGVPATPRDGAAIELVGLLKATTRWLTNISGSQVTPVQSTGRTGSIKLMRPVPLRLSASTELTSSSSSVSPADSPAPISPAPGENSAAFTTTIVENHDSLKFSAPPEELPASEQTHAFPPPLFAEAAAKNRATASSDLEDFLTRKKTTTISVPALALQPTVVPGPDVYPWQGVTIKKSDGTEQFLSYADWDAKIKVNFEKSFYVPHDAREDTQYRITRTQVARRSIYKDTYKSTAKYTDYQLRPNMCVAMVVAPELFVPTHASEALDMVEKHLLGPLGMRTLDPGDSHYRGYYDNGNTSDDYYMAGGFSYHMGPEWLWLVGFFLRARLQFRSKAPTHVLNSIQRVLAAHREALNNSDWKGLPELTNKDGAFCPGSCTNQAWSSACLLEALYDLHQYQ